MAQTAGSNPYDRTGGPARARTGRGTVPTVGGIANSQPSEKSRAGMVQPSGSRGNDTSGPSLVRPQGDPRLA